MPEERKHPAILPQKSLYFQNPAQRHSYSSWTQRKKSYTIKIKTTILDPMCKNSCKKNDIRMCHLLTSTHQHWITKIGGFTKGSNYSLPPTIPCNIGKRYRVIVTCLTSRAIHLELVSSLDTDSCINAFRRFTSRRCQVKEIQSDNWTNFIATENELKEAMKEWSINKREKTPQQRDVSWIFNPPSGAYHGGVWEWLICLVKKTVLSVCRNKL